MATLGWSLTRIGNRAGVWMYRHLNGRLSSGRRNVHVLVITVPGRRTGLPRSACIRYLNTPGGLLVLAPGQDPPATPTGSRTCDTPTPPRCAYATGRSWPAHASSPGTNEPRSGTTSCSYRPPKQPNTHAGPSVSSRSPCWNPSRLLRR
jgi:hypothetical protein